MKRLAIMTAMFAVVLAFLMPAQAEAQSSGTATGSWSPSERTACTTAQNSARNEAYPLCGRDHNNYTLGSCACTYDGDRPRNQRYRCDVSWSCGSVQLRTVDGGPTGDSRRWQAQCFEDSGD